MTTSPTNASWQPVNDSMQRLKALAIEAGKHVTSIEAITGSGSNRRYFRLRIDDGTSLIGVVGTCKAENDAFIYLSDYFSARNLPVPKVVAVSEDRMVYLQQDLGSESLLDHITDTALIGQSIRLLPQFQILEAIGLDFSHCYPVAEMDRKSVMWDFNYFKYSFLKLTGTEIDEPALENEFELMAETLLSARPLGFMVRDFQSRNIMIHNGSPWLIDFQGGRRGPVHYDVASFLWQTRANFSQSLRDQMISEYCIAAGLSESSFRQTLPDFVAFRMMQVLGAYGFRGLFERKAAFMTQIPPALSALSTSLNEHKYPYLHSLVNALITRPEFSPQSDDKFSDGVLTVEVLSFSYRKGLPIDRSGNGGGFVFDCRAIHNPGRYDQYKQLTGRDPEVIDFLESNGEITEFLTHCYALVDNAVERYLSRGFTHLQVAFGCTGGRHRSLYSADHMAEHLKARFGNAKINITLTHREQPSLK